MGWCSFSHLDISLPRLRGQLVQVSTLHPGSKALENPPSSHLSPLLGLAKVKFQTQSLPVSRLWHSLS